MKLKTLFTIYAFFAIVFGLGFLLFPEQSVSSYGVSLGEPGKWVTRYLGATFIGLSVLTWSARHIPESDARPIVLGLFVGSLIGLIIAIFDVIDAAGNILDWLTFVVYLFYTISFGYIQFIKRI